MYCQISIKRCRTAVALKSALGRALHYLREQWTYLIRFLKDGRQKLNNNRAERSVKPIEEVSLIEREKLTDVKLSTLQKVAALTGLTVSELLSIEMTEEESGLVSGSV